MYNSTSYEAIYNYVCHIITLREDAADMHKAWLYITDSDYG